MACRIVVRVVVSKRGREGAIGGVEGCESAVFRRVVRNASCEVVFEESLGGDEQYGSLWSACFH